MRRETLPSRRRAAASPAAWVAIAGCAILIAGAGCARHAKMQPPPSTEVTAGPKIERQEPPPADEEGIRLPGQDRYLPSEDPRNRPQGTASAMPAAREPASAEKRTAEAPLAASISDSASLAPPGRAIDPAAAATPARAIDRAPAPAPARAVDGAPAPAPARPVAPSPAPAPARPVAPSPTPAPPGPVPSPDRVVRGPEFRVQIFASSIPEKARRIRDEVASRTKEPASVEEEGGVWKVRVGEPMGREEAGALRARLSRLGYHDAFVTEVRP